MSARRRAHQRLATGGGLARATDGSGGRTGFCGASMPTRRARAKLRFVYSDPGSTDDEIGRCDKVVTFGEHLPAERILNRDRG